MCKIYYIAVRHDEDDVILFDSMVECEKFCQYNRDYHLLESCVYDFKSAREIWESEESV